jgi:hypothetical protein
MIPLPARLFGVTGVAFQGADPFDLKGSVFCRPCVPMTKGPLRIFAPPRKSAAPTGSPSVRSTALQAETSYPVRATSASSPAFRCVPNERSEEEPLFVRQFEPHPATHHAF